jgi:hypothetical protein
MAIMAMDALEYTATKAGWIAVQVDPNPMKDIDDLYCFIIPSLCGVIIQ